MNIALKEKWEKHYLDHGIDPSNMWSDGFVDESTFRNARHQILFVAKEADSIQGGNLRDLMSPRPQYALLHMIARWSFGILNNFPDFTLANNMDNMIQALSEVAVINLKKKPGGPYANPLIISAYTKLDRDLLIEQIDYIKPSVIIACGTIEHFIWLLETKVLPEQANKPFRETRWNSWVIPFRHPVRSNSETTYNDLRKLFKEINL